MVTCKRVQTIHCDGHCLSIVETKDHLLFIGGAFVGTCAGNRLHIAPAAPPAMHQALEHYASARGWAMSEGTRPALSH